MPFTPGDSETYYHLALNKLVRRNTFFDPPGLMTLDAGREYWVGPDDIGYKDISFIMATRTVPPYNTVFATCGARFVYERLMSSTAWIAIHGDRLYEDVGVPPKSEYPYGVVTAYRPQTVLWTGEPGVVGKTKQRLEVLSVRNFPQGTGSWFDFDGPGKSFDAMQKALNAINYYTVTLDGGILGVVESSEYITESKRISADGDYESLHHGALFDVIWT